MNRERVACIECGFYTPTLQKLEALATALGVQLWTLFDDPPELDLTEPEGADDDLQC